MSHVGLNRSPGFGLHVVRKSQGVCEIDQLKISTFCFTANNFRLIQCCLLRSKMVERIWKKQIECHTLKLSLRWRKSSVATTLLNAILRHLVSYLETAYVCGGSQCEFLTARSSQHAINDFMPICKVVGYLSEPIFQRFPVSMNGINRSSLSWGMRFVFTRLSLLLILMIGFWNPVPFVQSDGCRNDIHSIIKQLF